MVSEPQNKNFMEGLKVGTVGHKGVCYIPNTGKQKCVSGCKVNLLK